MINRDLLITDYSLLILVTIHHQYSIFLSDGAFIHVITTIAIVIQPPKTTDGTTPISLAARPLSNWPSSLLEFTNIPFTLSTLPRMLSGVFNCIIVPRTTT